MTRTFRDASSLSQAQEELLSLIHQAESKTTIEEYVESFTRHVLPYIFGDKEITLAEFMGINGSPSNKEIAAHAGENFDSLDAVSSLMILSHKHMTRSDELGRVKILSAISFPLMSSVEGVKELHPSRDLVSISSPPSIIFDNLLTTWNSATYQLTQDASSAKNLPDIERIIPYSLAHNRFDEGALDTVTPLMKIRILDSIETTFGHNVDFVNAKIPPNSTSPLTPYTSFFNPSPSEKIAMDPRGILGYTTPTFNPVVVLGDNNNDQVVTHEFGHVLVWRELRGGHPATIPRLKGVLEEIKEKFADDFPPTILESLTSSHDMAAGVFYPTVCQKQQEFITSQRQLGLLDEAALSLTKTFSHRYNQAGERNFTHYLPDEILPKVNYRDFLSLTNPLKKVASNAIRNFICLEMPVIALKSVMDRSCYKNASEMTGNVVRAGLSCALFGIFPTLVSSAIVSGTTILASDKSQHIIKHCAKKSGINPDYICSLLEEGHKNYKKLPTPLQGFIKQFITTYALTSVNEYFALDTVNLNITTSNGFTAKKMFMNVCGALEGQYSSLLTALLASGFKTAIDLTFPKKKNEGAAAPKLEDITNLEDIETGGKIRETNSGTEIGSNFQETESIDLDPISVVVENGGKESLAVKSNIIDIHPYSKPCSTFRPSKNKMIRTAAISPKL